MRIGYPCINLSIDCKGGSTFRLKSYSEQRLITTIKNNLDCLLQILEYNAAHNILFFRISSDLVPFASHPVNDFNWQSFFAKYFRKIGGFVKDNNMRISMHPDQFTLLNSPEIRVLSNSVRELLYHAQVLDLLGLDETAKIQIHVGGIYADKAASIDRFISRYEVLDKVIRKRLVIENDDRLYSWKDCQEISQRCGIPVLFDIFHHSLNNRGESPVKILHQLQRQWQRQDGIPMLDYSSQEQDGRKGRHSNTLNDTQFKDFLQASKGYDFDIMLEIKDKERSALKAIDLARKDSRLISRNI